MVDTILHGCEIKKGDKVVLYYGAANRDEDAFVNSDQFDMRRSPNRHLAFGGGHHVCLGLWFAGQWFAKLEIDAILHEVLSRMRNLELSGEASWMPSNFISGLTRMPVTFDPA